jgi:hypothetical protein
MIRQADATQMSAHPSGVFRRTQAQPGGDLKGQTHARSHSFAMAKNRRSFERMISLYI